MLNTCSTAASASERRRSMRPFFILFLVYMMFNYLLESPRLVKDTPLAWAIALGAGISMVGMLIAAAIGLARQRDEFQRKLLTEAMIWGTGGMLAITTIWGLLENHTSVPHLNILFNFPIFMVITAVAKVTLFRRNAAGNE